MNTSTEKPINSPCKTPWQQKWLRLDCHNPRIQGLADIATGYCRRWFNNQPTPGLLVLAGESNCGKTHTAKRIRDYTYAAAMTAFDAGRWDRGARIPDSFYCSWPEATDRFKEGIYSDVESLNATDLAIIDDIGAEHDPSKNATDKLCQILSRRERKFTVITTNIKPEDWPNKFDTRIADRLLRNSELVDLFGLTSYAMR